MHDIAEFLSAPRTVRARSSRRSSSASPSASRSSTSGPAATIFRQGEGPPDAMWVAPHGGRRAARRRPGARPARRGRALRPSVDALRAADGLGSARPGEIALLPARRGGRDPAARRPGRAAVRGAGADGPSPAGRRADAREQRTSTSARRRCACPGAQAARGLRARGRPARRRRADGGAGGQLDPRRRRAMASSGSSPTATSARGSSRPVCRLETPRGRGDDDAGGDRAPGADRRRADAADDRPGHPARPGRLEPAASCSAWPPTSTCSPTRRHTPIMLRRAIADASDVAGLRATVRSCARR